MATREPAIGPEARLFEPAAAPTLEDRILEICERLYSSGEAGCPVCVGRMRAVGGCEDCGSELS